MTSASCLFTTLYCSQWKRMTSLFGVHIHRQHESKPLYYEKWCVFGHIFLWGIISSIYYQQDTVVREISVVGNFRFKILVLKYFRRTVFYENFLPPKLFLTLKFLTRERRLVKEFSARQGVVCSYNHMADSWSQSAKLCELRVEIFSKWKNFHCKNILCN